MKGFAQDYKKPNYKDETVEENKNEPVGDEGDEFTNLEKKVNNGNASPSEVSKYISELKNQ